MPTQKVTGAFGRTFQERLHLVQLGGGNLNQRTLYHCQIGQTSAEYGAVIWRIQRRNCW